MPPRVFVSATRKDLDDDCLPAVRDAIKFGDAFDVDMTTWAATHGSALKISLEKVAQASHYVGVFAFLRGYCEPEDQRSITEAEYRHARGCHADDNIAVFVPEEGSRIEQILLERARELGQSADNEKAQRQFLAQVMDTQAGGGVVNFFPSEGRLALLIREIVEGWQDGDLVSLAEKATLPATSIPVDERQIRCLGAESQLSQFELSLNRLPQQARLAYVVHGPPGHAQQAVCGELVQRLEERRAGPKRRLTARLRSAWGGKSVRNLAWGLARCVRKSWRPKKLDELAAEILVLLRETDLVLEIADLEHFPGGLAGFEEKFWRVLLAHMEGLPISGATHDMIALLSFAETLPPDAPADLLSDATSLDAGALVALFGLQPIEQQALVNWVRRWIGDMDRVAAIAQRAFAGTAGLPERLQARLLEPETWGAAALEAAGEDEDWIDAAADGDWQNE